MKKIIYLLFVFTFIATFSFSQDRDIKLAIGIAGGIFPICSVNYEAKANVGINIETDKNDVAIYFSYAYLINGFYRGHFLGASFHYIFLSPKKRFRPLLSISILSEIASNYKMGYLMGRNAKEACFGTRDFYSGHHPYTDNNSPYLNSSNLYHSTPFLGDIAAGLSVRLLKNMFLNLSVGYKFQLMKYKYLEWFDKENYQDKLNDTPVKTKSLSYITI